MSNLLPRKMLLNNKHFIVRHNLLIFNKVQRIDYLIIIRNKLHRDLVQHKFSIINKTLHQILMMNHKFSVIKKKFERGYNLHLLKKINFWKKFLNKKKVIKIKKKKI